MRRIGITGTIASGKTSVSILLRRHGFSVFNSDQYGKMALHKGNACYDELVSHFGTGILDETGDIGRKQLADKIFTNEEDRLYVNSVIHPYVREGMNRFFENRQEEPFAFAEVPLLFEAKMEDCFDEICVVTCEKETAVRRMMEDRDYSEEEALARYASQIDPAWQVSKADHVIHNDGSLTELNDSVNAWLRQLRKQWR